MTIPNLAQHSAGSSITLGREALLQALGERLRSERRLVIGTDPILKCSSGVGQTHLVSRLVENLTGGVVTLLELSCQTPVTWQASLLRAACQLGIRQTRFRRLTDLTGAIRSWLRSHENWLLVADSLNSLHALDDLIAGCDSGRVIAILCQPSSGKAPNWPAAVPLGALTSDDALRLLGMATGREWHNTSELIAATQVVATLERNPRSVVLAGRVLRLASWGPQEFLASLKSRPSGSVEQAGLSLLVSTIKERDPDAYRLLAALVACGPHFISNALSQQIVRRLPHSTAAMKLLMESGLLEGLSSQSAWRVVAHAGLMQCLPQDSLAAGARWVGESLPERAVRNRLHEHVCGEVDRADSLDEFAELRVAIGQVLVENETLTVEDMQLIRIAADVAHELLLPDVAETLLLRVLQQAVQAENRAESVQQPLLELAAALQSREQFAMARRRWRQAVEYCPPQSPMSVELMLAIAEIDLNENRLDRAMARLVSAGEIIKQLPSSPHTQLMEAARRYLKAGFLLARGDTSAARDLFRRALELRTPLLPIDHLHLMRNRLMLARTEFLLKNYAASEQILREEIEIREQSPNVSDAELAVACSFLAEQYYLNGRLSEAEAVYERTLELRRATRPAGHRSLGEMANRLAVIKSARGAFKESDSLFREALSSLEQVCGEEHPEVARVLNDLAESLFAQNKVEPARRLLEKALHIQEKSLLPKDSRLSRTRCNLASVYVTRGRFAEAVRLYERDLADRQSQQVPDKALLATSLNNLAEALRSLGRNAEAEQRLEHALALREELVGPDHPHVAQVLNNLGYLHLQQHRYVKASECLQRALQIRESCLSADHPHLATTLGTLAEIQFAQGQYEAARPLYLRAIEIARNAFGERHPQVASLQICSARNELRLGHIGRAELMFLRGRATVEDILGANHRMSSHVLLGLAELAHAEKRYEAAFPLLERCLSIQQGTMSAQRLEIAETLQRIAENLAARGLHRDALPRITEAMEIQQRMLGPQHHELIPSMWQIGVIHHHLSNAAAAEEAFRYVIDHADAATQSHLVQAAREKLPEVLIPLQKYDEAVELLTRKVDALLCEGASFGLLDVCSQLAGVHYLRHQPAAAAPLMERCVELSEQLHGADSPETAKHLDNLAGVRFLLGEYATAEPAIRRSMEILEAESPLRPAALAKARENYIELLRQTNRIAEADQMASLAMESVNPVPAHTAASLPTSHVLDDL